MSRTGLVLLESCFLKVPVPSGSCEEIGHNSRYLDAVANFFTASRPPVLADFGEFLGWFADRTFLLMKNHPLLGSGSLVSCLLFNFRGQASRRVKQTTPTGRQLGLFATSHCYYVMLVKSEVFQASHIPVDAAF
jgi:hypothetical protein